MHRLSHDLYVLQWFLLLNLPVTHFTLSDQSFLSLSLESHFSLPHQKYISYHSKKPSSCFCAHLHADYSNRHHWLCLLEFIRVQGLRNTLGLALKPLRVWDLVSPLPAISFPHTDNSYRCPMMCVDFIAFTCHNSLGGRSHQLSPFYPWKNWERIICLRWSTSKKQCKWDQ